jgi:hypothetical protein
MKPAASIDQSRGMESQHSPARHTDAISRHRADHQCAGRQARSVDHDAVTRFTQVIEHINELTDLSATTAENANLIGHGRSS